MSRAIPINNSLFENLIEIDVYSLSPIINPVVLGCGNARERMEAIWGRVVASRQGTPRNSDNNPVNMAYICVVDRNQSTERGVIDRIRQGESISCPRRCQGNNTLVSRVYEWDLLNRLYAQDPDSQDDCTSTGEIRCIANVMNVKLTRAAVTGSIERVRKLCEDAEIDVNYTDKVGRTALTFATIHGHGEVVKLLIEKGAEVRPISIKPDETALTCGQAYRGHGEVVKLLIEKGAEINRTGKAGVTALMAASLQGQGEIVRLLIEKGAEVNHISKAERTALMSASRNGHGEVVQTAY